MAENIKTYNTRFFVILAFVIGLLFFFKNSISAFLLNVGNSVDYDSLAFYIGYGLFVLLALAISLRSCINRYIPHKNITFFIVIIVVFYCYLRFLVSDTISFIAENQSIKFADLVLAVGLIFGINLLIVYLKNPDTKNDKAFFLEDALFQNGDLTNEKILQKLIKSLTSFKPEIAFSIGINAVWGYGKSSFLHKFKADYPKTNPKAIVFWYRVWKNKGVNAIIENFFEELSASLKPFSGELDSEFKGYVDAILQLPSTEISKLMTLGRDAINGKETLEKHFLSINNTIAKIDRQIIVLLDDMDRLEREEILNTLKLIRTLSDFNNLIFIVGYDRKYIVETIQKPKESYLDKVFNVEINLLPFDENLITQQLFKELDGIYYTEEASGSDDSSFNEGFKTLFLRENKVFPVEINMELFVGNACTDFELSYLDFLSTFRDVKRFINEFRFNESFLDSRNDVVASEYILLKLLAYKYRYVQNDILNDIENVLSKGILDHHGETIADFQGMNSDILFYDDKAKERLLEILRPEHEGDYTIINAVFCRLFFKKNYAFYQINQNSITKVYYLNLYLRNNIASGQITISQLQKAFATSSFYKLIEGLGEDKLQNDFSIKNELKYFIFRNDITSKEQFEDVVSSFNRILHVGTHNDDEKVLETLKDGSDQYYTENTEEFYSFLSSILCQHPHGYISNLLSEINLNEKRIGHRELYSGGILDYKNNFFGKAKLEQLMLENLDCLIKKGVSPNEVLEYYNKTVGRILADKKILKHKEVNEILKQDMVKRFDEYYLSNVFDSINGNALRNDLHFEGIAPYAFFPQIFSDPQTNSVLLKTNVSDKDFESYLDQGWRNFQTFLDSLPEIKDDKMNFSQENLNNTKATINAFIKNNYRGLKETQYKEIWDKSPNEGFKNISQ